MICQNRTEDFIEGELTTTQEMLIQKNARDPALIQAKKQRKAGIVAAQVETGEKNRKAHNAWDAKCKQHKELADQIALELEESVIQCMKGQQLKEQLTKHWLLGDEECLQPGYKWKEGEKTVSMMKVDEQWSFLIKIMGHFKVHQLEGVIDAGDRNGNNDDGEGMTDEDC